MTSSKRAAWMTWANLLTLVRACSIWPLTYSILEQSWWIASAIFTIAVLTDVFDGKLARRYQQTSAFGGLFDHATDATLVTAGCWALSQLDQLPVMLAVLIPLAFLQYMLDSRVLAGHSLRTSLIGRYNGVAYFVVIGVGVGAGALNWLALLTPLQVAGWLLCVTTVISMGDRAIALRKLRRK